MQPLGDLVVLDLSRILAGPFCTQLFADLGATVWKIESPWGDDTRAWGPPFVNGESAYYLSANRGKKSIAVNLRDQRGQELVRRLAQKADVLVENFKTGHLVQYGLDYDSLAKVNPRLVYASITGFGQTGPRAGEAGYDAAIQGLTGIMSVTGEPDGPPSKVGVAWVDLLTGLVTGIGVLAALRERDASGKGQHLDMSLFDVGLMCMVNLAQSYLATGQAPQRLGSANPQIVPYQPFEASDKWFVLAVGNDAQYQKLTEVMNAPGLWQDERFRTNAGRVERREELVARLAAIFQARPASEWLTACTAAGIPAAPIHNLAEAFQDPQARARDIIWRIPHPSIGDLPLVASALQHMSRTPAVPTRHPPLLGEHTAEVLRQELGLDALTLKTLEWEKVIVVNTAGHPGANG